jgi:hypothetical protein
MTRVCFIASLLSLSHLVQAQDTHSFDVKKTTGGCTINHPSKQIIFASTSCGVIPEFDIDSIINTDSELNVQIIQVRYYGQIKEGEATQLFKTIKYQIDKKTVVSILEESTLPQFPIYERSYWNDTITTFTRYQINGKKNYETIWIHPQGEQQDLSTQERFEYGFHDEDGSIAYKYRYVGDKLNGDYLQYDDSSFVTHWVFKDNKLIDVKNKNCRFLNPKGKVITKAQFFEQFESEAFGQWGYYLFEKFEPYSQLKCCNFVMYSDRYQIPTYGTGAKKLIRRLNKRCY